MDSDNDGRFPNDSPVEIRYPRSKVEAAACWAWSSSW